MKPSEISTYLASKPHACLRDLAAALGWHGLQLLTCTVPGSKSWPVVYYETTDPKFNLQINEVPSVERIEYQATVKAERYGILHTQWIRFELPNNPDSFTAALSRLQPLVHRVNFKNRQWLGDIKQSDRVRLILSKKKQRGRFRRRAE